MPELLPDDNDLQLVQPLQPWNWKRLLKWFSIFLLLFILALEWALHRPWGEPLTHVRLEPLPRYARDKVQPGSFCDLLEQACDIASKIRLPQEADEQFSLLLPGWTPAEFPEMNQAIEEHAAALALVNQASELPVEESFIPGDTPEHKFPHSKLLKLIKLQEAKALRSLQAGDLTEVEATFRVQFNLAERLGPSGGLIFHLVRNAVTSLAYRLVKRAAANATEETQLARLEALISPAKAMHFDAAELFRHELQSCLSYWQKNGCDLPKYAPLLGSEMSHRVENTTLVYSQVIDELEKTNGRADPFPIFRRYTDPNPPWKKFLSPDPLTRIWLGDVDSWDSTYADIRHNPEAFRRMTLAAIALQRHYLKTGAWPLRLEDAMPTPPRDPYTDDASPIRYELSAAADTWILSNSGNSRIKSNDISEARAKHAAKKTAELKRKTKAPRKKVAPAP